ncbi:MAG: neutral zinc metallopeptidase [Actinomycetota bacterium]|nr:neutral zinc metallopeptidase [Actinomycetota bacterium]
MRRSLRFLAVILSLVLLATACAKEADSDPLAVEGDFDSDVGGVGKIAPGTGLGDDDAPSSDDVVEAALLDTEAFWERNYEDIFGDPYEPIAGGFWAYGPDTEQPPCGEPAPEYSDIAENAFYCPSDDLIAWDNELLVPPMYEEFGGFTIGIVFAHEFGHAIQERAGIVGDTIMTELQADCFAGAWTSDVESGNSDYFELELEDLDRAVAGFLELRDTVGTSATDEAAHGTGFDRIGSFVEGYEQGLERCAEYPDAYLEGQLVITEVSFTDPADFERGGDLPLSDIADLAIRDLEDFWSVVFAELGETWSPVTDVVAVDPEVDEVTCGDITLSGDDLVNASFYCIDDDQVYIDAVNLVTSLYEIGDYAVATELARQYAYAAQVRLGNLENNLASNLQADCFAGLYASSGFLVNRENQELILSPGDLDEAVIAFLFTSDEASSEDLGVGTAFQRFDAYRTGFVDGLEACEEILEGGS